MRAELRQARLHFDVTTAIATEVQRRTPGRARAPRSAAAVFAARFRAEASKGTQLSWPSAKYQNDPVAFCRDILGEDPWGKQIEILLAVRDCKRVAIKSGHKIGKSRSAAMLAFWFFCSFPNARVVLSSTTSRQVDQILWRELRMMYGRSGTCLACRKAAEKADRPAPRPCPHSAIIEGDIHELARSGLKATDFREIVGFTAREAEAVAGISGANLLYLLDEASGIPEVIFEAIHGNRAGGARLVMFSNPTKTEGEFFEAWHSKEKLYKTITVSSEETPNVVQGREVIPGLALREWIEECAQEWGVDSPLYKIRVRGEFVVAEDGKIFSVHVIAEAEKRWYDAPDEGRLCIGLDPAGPGTAGDETVFCTRRGYKANRLYPYRGKREEEILGLLLEIIKGERRPVDEVPLVVVDREGPIGGSVYGRLRAHAEAHPSDFEVSGVRASDRAFRQPQMYDRVRDELWANAAQWLREGGAIPTDARLAKELHAPEWTSQVTGRLKVTPKDEIRKKLGRSPDRADALTLAVWTPLIFRESDAGGSPPPADDGGPAPFDPYYGGGIDPYAGGVY